MAKGTQKLLDAVIATGACPLWNPPKKGAWISFYLAGTGAVAATVTIKASNLNLGYTTIYTATLSGTGSASDGFQLDADCVAIIASCDAISGTNSALTVAAGF